MATKPLRVDGVDISHHQSGTLDFAAAARAGVKFIYHKATEATSFKDANYSKRRAEAKKAGLAFGAYHFAQPKKAKGDATKQAKYFMTYAKPKVGDLRPVLDLEVNPENMSKTALTAWVGEFVEEILRQTGYHPVIYTNMDLNRTFGCLLWVARYSNANTAPVIPKPWKKAAIRQFSNGVYGKPNRVAGFGYVDLNTLGATELTAITMTRPKPDKPKPVKPPVVKPPVVKPQPVSLTFRDATLNLFVDNAAHPTLQIADLNKARGAGATIIGVQEAAASKKGTGVSKGLTEWLLQNKDWRKIQNGQIAILWDARVWSYLSNNHVVAAKGKLGIMPDRPIQWVSFTNRATGKRLRYVNIHSPQQFASGANTPAKLFRVAAAKKYYTRLAELLKTFDEEQSRTVKPAYDLLRVGGDFNVSLSNRDKPWYPGMSLLTLFVPDGATGIDHILYSRKSKVAYDGRQKLAANSDHDLQVQQISVTF